ncbi:MAG: sensor histidine kinase [Butyricicoccus sp.]
MSNEFCAVAHHDIDCAAHRGGVREPESAAVYSGSDSMDALNGFVVEYKTGNQQEMTIEIPQENMQAFFSDFSQQVNEEKVRFERIGWYITALVTLLSAIIAYFFSGKALKPLKDFAQQTEQINEESLTDTRLPEDTTAEFRQLSESVNGMLDRLAQHLTRSGSSPAMRRTASHALALMQTRLELFAAEHQQMSEETAKLLHFQQEQVERLSALVRTLLEMSDLQSVPRTDCIDLAPMAEEVLVDLTPLAQKNGITLTQTGENVQLTGSDVLLYRVLFNLTENAIKYNRTGGSVEVSVEREGGQAAIRVRDTGPGIAEEYRDSIFQPFFRVDKSRSRAMGGVGLGLALVQEIVRLHGGTVRVEQSADTGTTILVTLPVGKAA